MKQKNSLIELYRFLFALNVVKNHGFLPFGDGYFGPGRVSVEFFFILSGFLLIRSLERWRTLPIKEAVLKMFRAKLFPLLLPTVIALVSNLIYNVIVKEYSSGLWSYLWYLHVMLVLFMGYVILRIKVKSDRSFLLIISAICILATILRFSGILYSNGFVRGAAAISLGMLLSYLPMLKEKLKPFAAVMLVSSFLLCATILCFKLGNLKIFGEFMGVELILDTLLYPALIYLTFNFDFKFGLFNYLGALSFGLYAFQCPAKLARLCITDNRLVLFSIILILTVGYDLVKRLGKRRKAKAAANKETVILK